jgi:hypothetical protein
MPINEGIEMQLFEFAIIKDEKKDKEGAVVEKAVVLVDVQRVLAKDAQQATLVAARSIPQEIVDAGDLDRIQVAVRPF